MRWSVVVLTLSGLGAACGGKSRTGEPSHQVEPVKACFPVRAGTSVAALQARAATRLGVVLADDAIDADEPDALARGQQLVDAVEARLRGPAVPPAARDLLHDLVAGLLDVADSTPATELPATVARAMQGELERFVAHWVEERDATLAALLTTSTTFVDGELADHYGLPRPAGGGWQQLELPAEQRAGILTLGAFLTRRPSPPDRATYLFEALSCQSIPPPPSLESIWDKLPRSPAKQIVREAYSDDQIACWNCHQYYVGFAIALDRYDELGRYRDSLNGVPIDTSYRIMTPTGAAPAADADGRMVEFSTPRELGLALGESEGVRSCLVERLLETLGAAELGESELSCVLRELRAKQGSFTSLLAILAPHYLGRD